MDVLQVAHPLGKFYKVGERAGDGVVFEVEALEGF
jgi:hypothetical protein